MISSAPRTKSRNSSAMSAKLWLVLQELQADSVHGERAGVNIAFRVSGQVGAAVPLDEVFSVVDPPEFTLVF